MSDGDFEQILGLIRAFCELGQRQAETAANACNLIEHFFKANSIEYSFDEFDTSIPSVESSELRVDGVLVESQSCSFTGGELSKGCEVITSLQSSQNHLYTPNINFNQKCAQLSTPNYYTAPAFAVLEKDLEKINAAKEIVGKAVVKKSSFKSKQLLVGNLNSPKNILVSHYDSLFQGAVDNASGTAAMLYLLQKYKDLQKDNLFIFDGNEELSYDKGIYWGHGYREFEAKYRGVLESAAQILVIDCIGYSQAYFYDSPEIIRLAFPLSDPDLCKDKCSIVSGDIDTLMTFYHSDADCPDLIKKDLILETIDQIRAKLV